MRCRLRSRRPRCDWRRVCCLSNSSATTRAGPPTSTTSRATCRPLPASGPTTARRWPGRAVPSSSASSSASATRTSVRSPLRAPARPLNLAPFQSTLSKLFAVDLAPFLAPLLPPAAAAPVAADFLRAYALVTSRAFLVDSFHQLALVPLFDLFNHSPDAPHVHLESHEWVCAVCGHWDWCEHERDSSLKPPRPLCDSPAPTIRDSDADDDDERIELVAHAPVAPGDEVFNTYGSALPNVRLALEYGFLAEANPFDTSSFAPADLPGAPSDLAAALGDLAPTIARVRLQDDEGPLTAAGGAGDLFFDADANVSVGLWCALVCRHRGPDADHERLVGTLEEAWDAALDPDARTPADNSADKAVLELVARDIVVLARGRRTGARVHRSDLSPADLLALADVRLPPLSTVAQ